MVSVFLIYHNTYISYRVISYPPNAIQRMRILSQMYDVYYTEIIIGIRIYLSHY